MIGGFNDIIPGLGQMADDFFGTGESSARRQNEIDRERADTAVQRKVKDLRAAGINPILAAEGQGAPTGAATPGGQGGQAAASIANSAMKQNLKTKKLNNEAIILNNIHQQLKNSALKQKLEKNKK